LKDLSELLQDPSLALSKYSVSYSEAMEDLSNSYFTTIPHVFGRNRPPVINTEALIKREVDLLEALTDMEISNEIMKDSKEEEEINHLDRMFQSLGMQEMTALGHDSSEYKELENYLIQSRGSTHYVNYQVSYTINFK
jgi:poly [ADP-ribose] polymerase